MSQITMSGVRVAFGATTLLSDVTWTVSRGDRWGVVGRNGTGKTSLLRLVTGELEPARGTVTRASGLRVAYLEQDRDFGAAASVWEAAAGPFAALLELECSLARQAVALGEAGEAASPAVLSGYARDLERFEREGGYTFAPRVDAVLHGLGFDPDAARTRPLSELSGGERGRVGLARQLVAAADVLLLDEPTNHLDLETTRWLEEHLRDLAATLILVSHDRAFLDGVVDHVLHLEGSAATAYGGSYSGFVRQRAERRLTQQRAYERQRGSIAAEEEVIRRNIAGQKSRQAKGRRRRLERLPRLSPPPGEDGAMALRLEAEERGGDQVLVADDVRLAAGGRVLVEGFRARVARGEVVGFVGPNGAGKSTLLRAVAGERETDGGELRVGASIRVAHYRQDLAQVPTGRSLYDVVHGLRPPWNRGQVQAHLGRFGFSGEEARRTTDTLSGGERARLALAMIVLSGANFLLLDEPTNHLDVESIEAVEDAVQGYDGTVLLVSHDRALLRSLATRVWVLHGARITDYPGSFAEWEVASEERAHAARVVAEEEEALRRVAERRQVRRAEPPGSSGRLRAARRALTEAEAEVAELEARIGRLQAELADPSLYAEPDGVHRATALGAELEATRSQLEAAIAAWADASQAAEELVPDGAARA
ncbi:MAG: ABC-F family ATP-binding cassette domain-containing protein [Gemmatimonadota bacterium]